MRDFLLAIPFILAWCLFLEFVLHPVLEAIADAVREASYRRNVKRRQARARALGINPDSLFTTFL